MVQHHIVIPNTVEVIANIAATGRTFHVTWHEIIPAGTAVTSGLADAIFGPLKAGWTTNLAPQCAPTTVFGGLSLRDLRDVGFPLVNSTTGSAAGTAATETNQLPLNIASCLTTRTAKAGKSFRGRMYWGGYCEIANGVNGRMSAAMKTALDAFAANFLTAVNVSGLTMGVAHRPTVFDDVTGLPVAPGLGFITPITNVLARDDVWDSQRRRVQ